LTKVIPYLAWWGGGTLLAAALLAFDPNISAMAPRWLAVFGLALAALAALAITGRPRLGWIEIAAVAFLGWAALSIAWSGDWRAGIFQWQNMACLFAIALMVKHCPAFDRVFYRAVMIGAVGLLALAWWRPDWHAGVGNPNFLAELLVLLFAFLVFMPAHDTSRLMHWLLVPILPAIALYLFIWNPSNVQHAAIAGWIGIGLVGLAKARQWRLLGVLIAVLAVVGIGMWHAGWLGDIETSLMRRAEIWINTLAMIAGHPLFGVGLGSFDYDYPRAAHLGVMGGTFLENPTDFMGAVHNEYLQLIVELGLVGAALAGLVGWLCARARWTVWKPRACGAGVLLTAAAIALFGFPAQNPSTGVLIAIAAGLFARGLDARVAVPFANLAGLGLVPLAVSMYLFAISSVQTALVPRWIPVEPVIALQANLDAIRTYPFPVWPRLQAVLSLRSVIARHGDRVRLQPDAADRIHWWGMTAGPNHPGILISRVEYLLAYDRWMADGEIEQLFDKLHKVAPMYAHGYALESVYAGLINDEERIKRSVLAAVALPGGLGIFQQMGLLRTTETAQ